VILGVGPHSAKVIVATIDAPHRFCNAWQFAWYAGLTLAVRVGHELARARVMLLDGTTWRARVAFTAAF
jgi:transposase